MRDMDVKMLSAVDGIATVPETVMAVQPNRIAVTELKADSETKVVEETVVPEETKVVEETKTVTRRTKK